MTVYIDDILLKIYKIVDHESDLHEIFKVIWSRGLMINPVKCTLG